MSYQLLSYLQGRFETGDVPTQQDYYDFFDSFDRKSRLATLTADSPVITMKVRYQGDTAPTLTKDAAGEFSLDIPSGTLIKGFHVRGDDNNLTATNTFELTITDADGESIMMTVQVFAQSNGLQYGPSGSVLTYQTEPSAGDVKLVFTNFQNFGGSGWIVAATATL